MQRLFLSTVTGILLAAGLAAQTVSVQGNVRSPGEYMFNADGSMTLMDAIRRAGGLLAGSGATAIVYRMDDHGTLREIKEAIPGPLDQRTKDFRLKPGDVLYVPGPGAKLPLRQPVIDDRIRAAAPK